MHHTPGHTAAGSSLPTTNTGGARLWRPSDTLIHEEAMLRSGSKPYGEPIQHGGFVEHRCQTRRGHLLQGYQLNGSEFPGGDFFRYQRTVRGELLEKATACHDLILSRTWKPKITIAEMAFASQPTEGMNVWARLEVDGEQSLFYMGRRTQFMMALWASLTHRGLSQRQHLGFGWFPILGEEHRFEVICDNPEHPISGFDEPDAKFGPVNMRKLPHGWVDLAVLHRERGHLVDSCPRPAVTA